MSSEQNNINDDDWDEIVLILTAFTHNLVKSYTWFRGKDTTSFKGGNEVIDYVMEAITRYFESPEKFDSSKGTRLNYLKLNLLRSLVGNDARHSENKKSKNIFQIADQIGEEGNDSSSYLDSILPHIECHFDEELDYETIINEIELSLSEDTIAQVIFNEIGLGLKRRDIIAKHNFSSAEFDNGMRRLKTVLNNVAKKYDIKKLSL